MRTPLKGQPARGFRTPPEVTEFFRDKGLRPSFSWQDIFAQENALDFTVAKAVELELLTAFRTSIQTAIDNGEGFGSWREKIVPELQRLGWYGRRRVEDPTGAWKSKIVDFSRPARLQIIFWSNVRAARAAGQWERAQQTKGALPYLVYARTKSIDPRAEHLAWVGVMLPVDHPFWATHFPPNGWNCKCSTLQITRRAYDDFKSRDGYTPDAPEIEWKTFANARTGEVTRVPAGIDPGWHTNPGVARARTLVDAFSNRLKMAGEADARAAIERFVNSPTPAALAAIGGESFNLPAAMMDGRIVTAPSSRLAGKRPAIRPRDLPLVQKVIDAAAAREASARGGTILRALVDGARRALTLSRLLEILGLRDEK